MRILLTNDDGIHAPGMQVLLNWAKTLGEVMIAAPKTEQSGKSHGIELHHSFEVKKLPSPDGVTRYSVDSTPADCVRFAILGLGEKFDLVISGVNRGLNIGIDTLYSGTVSAAMEAAIQGVKALAVSTHFTHFDAAEKYLPVVWNFIQEHDLYSLAQIYNVNIPDDATGSIRITRQGGPYYSDDFPFTGPETVTPLGKCVFRDDGNLDLDTVASLRGHISISPLTIDRTCLPAYQTLKEMFP